MPLIHPVVTLVTLAVTNEHYKTSKFIKPVELTAPIHFFGYFLPREYTYANRHVHC